MVADPWWEQWGRHCGSKSKKSWSLWEGIAFTIPLCLWDWEVSLLCFFCIRKVQKDELFMIPWLSHISFCFQLIPCPMWPWLALVLIDSMLEVTAIHLGFDASIPNYENKSCCLCWAWWLPMVQSVSIGVKVNSIQYMVLLMEFWLLTTQKADKELAIGIVNEDIFIILWVWKPRWSVHTFSASP